MPKKKDLTDALKKGQLSEVEEEALTIFQFNEQLGEFEELEIEAGVSISDLLDPDFILLFIDHKHYRVWLWHGSDTTTRMKFIAAKLAPSIRDRYGLGYKITAVDEGNEVSGFKVRTGLMRETDFIKEQTGPAYEGTIEDLRLLEELSREKIILLLEKAEIPEGYERKMVIVKNQLYGYKEYDRNYMGSVIKEKRIFPLKEAVPDGPYFAENLIPRMLFSFNNVVLTELLKKEDNSENNNGKKKSTKSKK